MTLDSTSNEQDLKQITMLIEARGQRLILRTPSDEKVSMNETDQHYIGDRTEKIFEGNLEDKSVTEQIKDVEGATAQLPVEEHSRRMRKSSQISNFIQTEADETKRESLTIADDLTDEKIQQLEESKVHQSSIKTLWSEEIVELSPMINEPVAPSTEISQSKSKSFVLPMTITDLISLLRRS